MSARLGSGNALTEYATECANAQARKLAGQQFFQRSLRGIVTAHAMHTAARRCGRRTDVQSLDRRRIRYEPEGGPRPELPQVLNAAVDVASDIIGIVLFHRSGRHDAACEDAIAKARREALNLRFDAPGHVEC